MPTGIPVHESRLPLLCSVSRALRANLAPRAPALLDSVLGEGSGPRRRRMVLKPWRAVITNPFRGVNAEHAKIP